MEGVGGDKIRQEKKKEGGKENIAKGTTDPRVQFILPKKLLEVISEVKT